MIHKKKKKLKSFTKGLVLFLIKDAYILFFSCILGTFLASKTPYKVSKLPVNFHNPSF